MLERARRRLIFWNVGVMIPVIALLIAGMYFSISRGTEEEISNDLVNNARNILRDIRYEPTSTGSPGQPLPAVSTRSGSKNESQEKDDDHDDDDEGHLAVGERSRSNLSDSFFLLVNPQGQLVANPRQISVSGLPDLSPLKGVLASQSYFRDVRLPGGEKVRLYSTPVRLENGKVAGMLQVGKSLASHEEQLRNVLVVTLALGGAGLVLALVAAFFLTGRALVPVRQSIERQREFVADASHELRTPLTLIRANAEVALRNKNKTIAQSAGYLEDICKETDYLTRLVADMLTLAQADMAKAEYKPEPVELGRLCQEVAREMQPLAQSKNLTLDYSSPGHETWIEGEPLRLRQLLVILVDNAIKYTQEGKVSLALESGRGQHVTLRVSDTGIGIPPDRLEHIWERFFRVDKARSRSEGGYGLGLAIAHWIIQIHGASVQVHSQAGRGTTFTLTFKRLSAPGSA